MEEGWTEDDIARAARAKKGSPFLSTEQAAFYLAQPPKAAVDARGGHRPPIPASRPLRALPYRRSR